jgi:aminopeptidase N
MNKMLKIKKLRRISVALIILSSLLPYSVTAGNSKRNSSIDVVGYTFRLTLSDDSDRITGETTIVLTIVSEVDSLRFDLVNRDPEGKGMRVDSVKVNTAKTTWIHTNNRLLVKAPAGSNVGDTIKLTVWYKGIPADGLIISETKFGKRSFFADHWPDRASNYIPCVDHVSDKAAVDFIITAPDHYTVVSNGLLISEEAMPGGYKKSHWSEKTPLPVKVMTFGAAYLDKQLAGSVNGTEVWSYVYPENSEEGFYDYAMALIPLNFYTSLIGQYPFPKLANVQSRTIYGGLENAGCIFYSENSVTGTGRSEGLIAHEIAHQWFGNSVTEADWHHIWLSEGFATYLTSMYWEMRLGEERLQADMVNARNRVLRSARNNPSPVIDTTITNLMHLLSANSYQKGAWVLHMLRNKIGDRAFKEGLRLYYNTFRDSSALTSDFAKVMEEVSGRDLQQFFYQWLMIPQNPELKVTWNYDRRSRKTVITVAQMQEHLFTFPLEINLVAEGKIYPVKTEISQRETQISVDSPYPPDQVVTDPNINLLFQQVE